MATDFAANVLRIALMKTLHANGVARFVDLHWQPEIRARQFWDAHEEYQIVFSILHHGPMFDHPRNPPYAVEAQRMLVVVSNVPMKNVWTQRHAPDGPINGLPNRIRNQADLGGIDQDAFEQAVDVEVYIEAGRHFGICLTGMELRIVQHRESIASPFPLAALKRMAVTVDQNSIEL